MCRGRTAVRAPTSTSRSCARSGATTGLPSRARPTPWTSARCSPSRFSNPILPSTSVGSPTRPSGGPPGSAGDGTPSTGLPPNWPRAWPNSTCSWTPPGGAGPTSASPSARISTSSRRTWWPSTPKPGPMRCPPSLLLQCGRCRADVRRPRCVPGGGGPQLTVVGVTPALAWRWVGSGVRGPRSGGRPVRLDVPDQRTSSATHSESSMVTPPGPPKNTRRRSWNTMTSFLVTMPSAESRASVASRSSTAKQT